MDRRESLPVPERACCAPCEFHLDDMLELNLKRNFNVQALRQEHQRQHCAGGHDGQRVDRVGVRRGNEESAAERGRDRKAI